MDGSRGILVAGLAITGLLALVAVAAPWLAPYDPGELMDVKASKYRPPGSRLEAVRLDRFRWTLADRVERTETGLLVERLGETVSYRADQVVNLTATGVADHRSFLLGSDHLGRDVFSRLIYGARTSLAIGLLAVAVAVTIGVGVGSLAGGAGAAVDEVVMRLVDALLAFPRLFLLLALAALLEGSTLTLILVLGGTSWMTISRLVRAQILALKQRDYVLAARATGVSAWRIYRRHLLPGAMVPVLVDVSLRVGELILLEASLSFLNMGVQPPHPSWGNMVADGVEGLPHEWWIAVFPGLAIALVVIGFNLFGDGLRDRLDPRTNRPLEG